MRWKAYFIIYLKLLAYLVPCLFLSYVFFFVSKTFYDAVSVGMYPNIILTKYLYFR